MATDSTAVIDVAAAMRSSNAQHAVTKKRHVNAWGNRRFITTFYPCVVLKSLLINERFEINFHISSSSKQSPHVAINGS
jgi:hypothetical protein